jgi:dihydropteroate synthase
MSTVSERLFERHRMAVMGVVNVTPDSFSDGGQHADATSAVAHALALIDAGAEAVDIGGESTRPGSDGVSADVELERVVPVIAAVKAARPGSVVSVDTSKTEVARAALDHGADLVNDVTAGAAPGMLDLVAARGAAVVLMHMRGVPRTMQTDTRYDDVVEDVRSFLVDRAEAALRAGIDRDSILLDPGIGFGKDVEGNLALLRGLDRLASTGHTVLVGTSRKSFLGLLTGAPVSERVGATLASLVPALRLERVVVRVHDVAEVVRFRTVLEALGLA